MPDSGNGAPFAPTDAQTAEQKMRRALGLGGPASGSHGQGGKGQGGKGQSGNQPRVPQQRPDQARQRHRFVQDGGVPVVVVNHRAEEGSVLKERITELERQLENERVQHANTRRALQEAQATANAIETRLVHQNLAHQEALAQERRALTSAQQALNEALTQQVQSRRNRTTALEAEAQRAAARAAEAQDAPAMEGDARPGPDAVVPDAVVVESAPKKRGRPRTRPLPEPKPVRWWTPGFRSKTKA